jgi:hypothetical protein
MSGISIGPVTALHDSKAKQHKFRILLWVCGAACIAMATAYWAAAPELSSLLAQPSVSPNRDPLPARTAGRGDGRPVYRHSVIAGGAYSVAEVERARRTDPVVDAHYAVFNSTELQMTEATSRAVYVSYRVGSHIYWTRNRVQLTAGEALITDGEHVARARCGNRVANTPQQPVGVEDPPAGDLDLVGLLVSSYVPPDTDLRRPSAFVGDLFPRAPFGQTAPPVPLGQIPQSGSATPGGPSPRFPPAPGSGMGSGGGTGTLAPGSGTETGTGNAAPAPTVPESTVSPMNGTMNGPSGSDPFVATQPGVGVYLQWFPTTTAFPGMPSENQSEYFGVSLPPRQNPITVVVGTIPPPRTWFPGGTPILQNPSDSGGGTDTGQTPLVVIPPTNPVFRPSDTAPTPTPEPGTATLLAIGTALVVIRERRRYFWKKAR